MTLTHVELSALDGIAVAKLDGEIDIANADEVGDALLGAAADQPIGLIVDLTLLRYLDSGGVRMLFKVAEQLGVSRRHLALVVPESSPLSRLIKIAGFGEAASVGVSVATCRDALVAHVDDDLVGDDDGDR